MKREQTNLVHLQMTLIVENTRSATALDYMFRTGMIFWSDSHDGRIFKYTSSYLQFG